MPQLLRLREVTAEEERAIGRLARSRTAPVRMVERARIVDLAAHGWRVPGIAAELEVSQRTVLRWVTRFTAQGLAGLGDAPRSGRPATYPTAVRALAAASLTDPQELGLPFGSWTLDQLAAYLHETEGISMQRSRVGEILRAEGLRWRQQETWFGERPDPALAEKRGPSSRSTRPCQRTASKASRAGACKNGWTEHVCDVVRGVLGCRYGGVTSNLLSDRAGKERPLALVLGPRARIAWRSARLHPGAAGTDWRRLRTRPQELSRQRLPLRGARPFAAEWRHCAHHLLSPRSGERPAS